MIKDKQTVILCILDGWGQRLDNKTARALDGTTTYLDALKQDYPCSLLEASGVAVGLPGKQMGNSEVGHMNLGAGRVVYQDLPRINEAIESNYISNSTEFASFVTKVKVGTGVCHLMGLLSPGGIHSHQKHMVSMIKLLTDQGIEVKLHLFLDGRDAPPKSAESYLAALVADIGPRASIATLMGRYYAMDRDNRWDRTEHAYNAIVDGKGDHKISYPVECITENYQVGTTDEFMKPCIDDEYAGMRDGDGLFHINFRADRVRQLLRSFVMPEFDQFTRNSVISFSATLGMTEYADDITAYVPALFTQLLLDNCLGEVLAKNKLRQLRLAETEKYAHVTFFFNGGRENPFDQEERHLIPSPMVATYDLRPEMSAIELTDNLLQAIESQSYDFILVNFANPDMVGHTGVLEAAQQAMRTVDDCIRRIHSQAKKLGVDLLITADHGNVETMFDSAIGQPSTAHTLNPVPFLLISDRYKQCKINNGRLADVAPTILELMNIEQPVEMTGSSLL
jgi:2,3-bisphosphoglycerate-independent phosphoglycerate mutase